LAWAYSGDDPTGGRENEVKRFAQRPAAMIAAIAIAAGGAVWAGCGDDTSNQVNKALDKSQDAANKGFEQAQKAADQAQKTLPEDAQKKIDKAQKEANQAIDKAKSKTDAAIQDAQQAAKGSGY
jgi:hypothetical protein